MMNNSLSVRAGYNLDQIIAKIPKSILEPPQDESDVVDLSMAENYLIREDIVSIVKSALTTNLQAKNLDWPEGFCGHSDLLRQLAALFNGYFAPWKPINSCHLTVTPGAAAALDAVLYNICSAGDGVLVPAPYWSGYDAFFQSHSAVIPVEVPAPHFEACFDSSFLHALEVVLSTSTIPIKGLILSNPHNPLGRCYSREVLEGCARFCQKHDIHLVSDEVFALSIFESFDTPGMTGFTSVLSLDPTQIGFDSRRVHVIWSMSKDLAISGVRMGCVVTHNTDLRIATALLTSVHVSSLATISAIGVLSSPKLAELINRNSRLLNAAYCTVTSFFKGLSIEYFACNSTIFVCAKLAPKCESRKDEIVAMHRYVQAGVQVAPGFAYHIPDSQRGWMRVSFAVDPKLLHDGLSRIAGVYQHLQHN